MLQLYVDDSGKLNDSPVCVLAGYLSTTERWSQFSCEWRAALTTEPRVVYLKATEAMHRQKEFYNFSCTERDEKLRGLVTIIKRHAMSGFITIIPSEPFGRTLKGWMDEPYLGRPYFHLFHAIIIQAVKYAQQYGLSDKIDFIFDRQDDEPAARTDFIVQFDDFVSYAPPEAKAHIGSPPMFRDDRTDAVPLQAADLLVVLPAPAPKRNRTSQ